MTKKEAISLTGDLSTTSKMPCDSWGIPAESCKVGAKLATTEGSVCFECYALKGAYTWQAVNNAYSRRLELFNSTPREKWIQAMVILIKSNQKRRSDYFRWFDSGDLQSLDMLERIVEIAYKLPDIKFWLPTKEYGIVKAYLNAYGDNCIPENLTIRLSAYHVDEMPKLETWPKNINGSSVGDKDLQITCPSSKQHGRCDDCRKCWDRDVVNVTYKKH
jgi:hypothetical protein